jgi:1-phosphatidylinositol phosphodiesterase
MKKKTFKYVALIIACVIISRLAVMPLQWGDADRSDWMAALDDGASLSSLTVPGTHDSGALHSIAEVSGKCQTLSIKEQLKIGVRFLDIRLQLVGDELKVVHSIVDQMTDFEDVLEDMADFVRSNGSEFLLVSIKEDASPKRAERDFAAVLEEMLLSYPEVSRSRELPATVKDARGGIHIIARYGDASIGLPAYRGWTDDDSFRLGDIYVQDNYRVSDAAEKIDDVRRTYSIAAKMEYDLVLNFTSCYLESCFPPIYAGLPAHDVNEDTLRALGGEYDGPLGVLVCDFMTAELADAIIGRNFA